MSIVLLRSFIEPLSLSCFQFAPQNPQAVIGVSLPYKEGSLCSKGKRLTIVTDKILTIVKDKRLTIVTDKRLTIVTDKRLTIVTDKRPTIFTDKRLTIVTDKRLT